MAFMKANSENTRYFQISHLYDDIGLGQTKKLPVFRQPDPTLIYRLNLEFFSGFLEKENI